MTSRPFLIFDMDGTLLDTRNDIARAANCARRELGLTELSTDDVVRAVGDGVNQFVSRVTFPIDDPRFAHARSVFLKFYGKSVTGDTVPYPGIVTMLDDLKSLDIPMAIVSNKPASLVDELVLHFHWQHYFKVWLGGDSAPRPKPAGDSLWMALERCGLPRSYQTVMIGDGHQDILAAKAIGCQAIWVQWGFNPEPTKEYPSFVAMHPRDVLECLCLKPRPSKNPR